MSRDPYSTRDLIEEQIDRIESEIGESSTMLQVGRALVLAVCMLTRAVADVADATRRDDR